MTRNEFTENQNKWLEALESGEWEQTTDFLRVGDAYCCLGVATKIVAPNSRAIKLDEYSDSFGHGDRGEQTAPPVTKQRMHLRGDGMALTTLNDNRRTFKEIAAKIRKRPWVYLTNFDKPEGKK